jgi:hypothetical protein
MLLTLMMNLGMYGEAIDVVNQDLIFDSEFDGDIKVDQFEWEFSVDSLIEQAISSDGSENNFGFDSGTTLNI